jgi:hypothetical protein
MTQTKNTPQRNNGATPAYPLFYKDPVLLQSALHRSVGLLPPKGFGFARQATSIPLCTSEFVAAHLHYPIAFAEDDSTAMPMVLTGLERDENLFVERDNGWSTGAYVPAYLRRYPFIVMENPDKAQRMLMVDQASDRFLTAVPAKSNAVRFFDEKGQPTPAAREAAVFCETYLADHNATLAFGKALKVAKILVLNQANITFADGRLHTVNGFLVVDEKAFRALPAEIVIDWHKRGWLDLVIMHLASQINWRGLIDRQAERHPGKKPNTAKPH